MRIIKRCVTANPIHFYAGIIINQEGLICAFGHIRNGHTVRCALSAGAFVTKFDMGLFGRFPQWKCFCLSVAIPNGN